MLKYLNKTWICFFISLILFALQLASDWLDWFHVTVRPGSGVVLECLSVTISRTGNKATGLYLAHICVSGVITTEWTFMLQLYRLFLDQDSPCNLILSPRVTLNPLLDQWGNFLFLLGDLYTETIWSGLENVTTGDPPMCKWDWTNF